MEEGQILVLCLLSLAVVFTTAAITLFASKPSLGCVNTHAWENWLPWGQCSVTCGKLGKMARRRHCRQVLN